MSMLPRTIMATTMEGGVPERIPYLLFAPSSLYEWLRWRHGIDPDEAYHQDFGLRWVAPRRLGKPPWDQPWGDPPDDPEAEKLLRERFAKYLPRLDEPMARVTEYGCMTVPGSLYHLRRLIYPMEEMTSPAGLEDYPFPDMTEEWRWQGLAEKAAEYLRDGYWVSGACGSIYETSWFCRGQERLLLDLHENPEFAEALLDRITADNEYAARRLAAMGVDEIGGGDDMGIQHGLIMSLPMLRKWIISRWERVFAAARSIKPDIKVSFHTDGRMQEAIPDLMAIGVNMINPVQPEVDDPEYLKQRFGRKLILCGTLSSQTLTFGSPEEVRAEVKVRMELGKRWGGLFLTPNNTPDRNTPFENFKAFLDASEEYGRVGDR